MFLFNPCNDTLTNSTSSLNSSSRTDSDCLYGGAPIWIIAISKVGSWTCGLVGNGGHSFNGAAEEATIGGPLPERPNPTSPVVLETASTTKTGGESSGSFGRKATAKGLDLLGDEGGGGDVGVAEIADLLKCLTSSGQRIHVERGQIYGRGGELLMGAFILGAQAVNPVV